MAEETKILVIGAAGRFAGMVVPELALRGATVRGLIHKAEDAEYVRANGAKEIAVGDLRDEEFLKAAVQGIGRIFYIAPAFSPDEIDLGLRMVRVAAEAGVRRFVFSSVIHPELSALGNHSAKFPVENAVLESGMEYVFLHPAVFFQNYTPSWSSILQNKTLAEPYAAESRMSRVDYRDVSEVAAIALTEDWLLYGTFELCADGILNRYDVAHLIENVLGEKISVAAPSFDEWTSMVKVPHDTGVFQSLKAMYDWYNLHELLGNPLTLRAILGRPPRSLQTYFAELANASYN